MSEERNITLTALQEKDYAQKLFLKIFFILTPAIALANLIIYFLEGEVPALTQVQLFPNYIWILPFEISSWWTIITGAFVASLVSIVWLFYHNSECIPIWKITIGCFALASLVNIGYGIGTAWIIALILYVIVSTTIQSYDDSQDDGMAHGIWLSITLATTSSIGYQGFFGLLLTELLIVIIITIALTYLALREVPWYWFGEQYYIAKHYLKRKFKSN